MRNIKIVLLGLLLIPSLAIAQSNQLKIATPVWEGYTEENGDGFYHDLFRAIFEPEGIELSFTYAPFNRCQKLILDGEVDSVPASYFEPERGTIYPDWHMGTDFLSALYRNEAISKWDGEKSLEGRNVGWVRGYKLDEFGIVKSNINKHILRNVATGLRMLERGRIDVLLDYSSEITPIAASENISLSLFNFENTIPGLKLYMEFANSDKGKRFAELFDKGMKRLYTEGKLQEWFLLYDGEVYKAPVL